MEQMTQLMDNRLHGAILEQDQRMQTMMAQVMQHLESRLQQQVDAGQTIPNGLPDASMEEQQFPPSMPM